MDISKINIFCIKELANKFSMPYLNSYENQWRNAEGNLINFDDMSNSYLENCLKEMDRCYNAYILRKGYVLDLENHNRILGEIMDEVDIDIYKISNQEKEEIIDYILKCTDKLFQVKKSELNNELEKRKRLK